LIDDVLHKPLKIKTTILFLLFFMRVKTCHRVQPELVPD
jgi:hypothetical protein